MEVEICEKQYSFMPGKSTTDSIIVLWILLEKYRKGQQELYCVFADLEKAYDRVLTEELCYCLRKSAIQETYVQVMYNGSLTHLKVQLECFQSWLLPGFSTKPFPVCHCNGQADS